MENKEIINNLEQIAKDVSRIESYVSDLPDLMEQTKELVKLKGEVEDFLYELIDNEKCPDEVRERAGELWEKI